MTATVLVHIGLVVTDIALSERFYTEAFGFVRDRELRIPSKYFDNLLQVTPQCDLHAVYLLLGGFTLELMTFSAPSADTASARIFNQTGLTHLSIAIDDMDKTLERCQALGATIFSRDGHAAIIRDPDGQLIELLDPVAHGQIEDGRRKRAAKNV